MTPDNKPRRLTLTKSARSSAAGSELLAILRGITADGRISDSEVQSLHSWLSQARADFADIPAVAALRDVVESALGDGIVTYEERQEIVVIILRTMPPEDRETARANVDASTASAPPKQPAQRRPRQIEPASAAQLSYLRALNVAVDESTIGKKEASEAIDRALSSSQGVSNRQMMVLRFWNKVEVANGGRRSVSAWLDTWYQEDPDRIAAWELWKEAHGDCGHQANPDGVPIGAGHEWIKKVKAKSSGLGVNLAATLILGVLAALGLYGCKAFMAPPP